MSDIPLLVIDGDPASGPALAQALRPQGSTHTVQPEVALFNHRLDRRDELLACCTAKLYAPGAAIALLSASA